MDNPLVSIICLCYNHENYVKQAIASVLSQSYDHVELIVVDDASTDGSISVIEKALKVHASLAGGHGFQVHFNQSNLGNCKSFNIGLNLARGKYIIDLAADDQLMPTRISEGVKNLEEKGGSFAVDFCDVELIDENGHSKGTHFKRDQDGKLMDEVPEGDLYKTLVERYFLSAPAMMMRRSILEELGGYDENLSYEDFDFWVRSARKYKYAFTNQVLVKKHILSESLSSIQYQRKNRHCMSTAIVCEKAYALNKTEDEHQALLKRIRYELKWSLITENWEASLKFIELKKKLQNAPVNYVILNLIVKLKPRWYWFWKLIL